MNLKLKHLTSCILLMLICSIGQAEVVFQDTHGQNNSLSSLKGKWVFINYWAGWCQTCVDEIPEFNRFYLSHKNDPIALYAVNFDNLPLLEQNSLIQKLNINYPSLIKDPAHDLRLGDITGVPVTFIFNPEGQLVKTLYGGQTAKSLNQVIVAN